MILTMIMDTIQDTMMLIGMDTMDQDTTAHIHHTIIHTHRTILHTTDQLTIIHTDILTGATLQLLTAEMK